MTAPFDPLKAAHEQLSGLQDVHKVVDVMVRDAERRASEAQTQLDALLKVRGVVTDSISQHRMQVDRLRADAEREAKGKPPS